jgi:predicted Zn-dependent protease
MCKSLLFTILLVAVYADSQATSKFPISDADEVRLGESAAPRFAELQGMAAAPGQQQKDIEAYLQKVGDKVAAHAARKMPWKFHLDPDPRFKSAVALPGGQVFVGGGILALMDREDELAIVIGHEIAHIDLGQVNQRIVEQLEKHHLTQAQMDKIPAEEWGANYGRERETACDQAGMKMAVAAGYSPYGAVRMLDVYRYFFSQDDEMKTKYLPAIEDRIKSANELIAKEGWQNLTKQTPLNFPDN